MTRFFLPFSFFLSARASDQSQVERVCYIERNVERERERGGVRVFIKACHEKEVEVCPRSRRRASSLRSVSCFYFLHQLGNFSLKGSINPARYHSLPLSLFRR